jgi:hypothetical protein
MANKKSNANSKSKKPVYAKPGTPSKPTIVKPDSKGVVRIEDSSKGDYTIDLNNYSKKTTKSKAPVKKSGVANTAKTPVKPSASKPKTAPKKTSTPKYVEPGTKEYWAMTPDQRNANTMLNIKESISGGPKKTKTPEKKVTPPISKAPVNKTPAKKDTTPKKESFNLDAEVKKVMSGAYGSGSARKEALGSNYSKVQAEINKRAAANKPKVSAPKTEKKPVAKPEPIKMEIKRPGKIESTGPKELQGVIPPKSAVDVDKSIDAAMDAIGKSKIMRKGGSVKSKTTNKMKTMKRYQGGGSTAADKAMATPPKSSVKEEAAIPSAKKMKTGGMVNPNAKLQASKKAGSKGVMHSLSAKAVVQKKAKGRSGGTSKAPKTATPKAKYGMIMRKK